MKIYNGNDWFGGFPRNEDLFFSSKGLCVDISGGSSVCEISGELHHCCHHHQLDYHQGFVILASPLILQPNPSGWCPVEDDDNLSLTAPVLR